MKIIITQWGLDLYLNLAKDRVFSKDEYWNGIRPDIFLLLNYSNEPKFNNNKFWSVAEDSSGNIIPYGFKMKWHQVGNGKVQLRLPIILDQDAYLCGAYVKRDEKFEKRRLAIFKTHAQLILQNNYKKCGILI